MPTQILFEQYYIYHELGDDGLASSSLPRSSSSASASSLYRSSSLSSSSSSSSAAAAAAAAAATATPPRISFAPLAGCATAAAAGPAVPVAAGSGRNPSEARPTQEIEESGRGSDRAGPTGVCRAVSPPLPLPPFHPRHRPRHCPPCPLTHPHPQSYAHALPPLALLPGAASAAVAWFGQGHRLPSVSFVLVGLLGATLALSVAYRRLRHTRAVACDALQSSPAFKGIYSPFLQAGRSDAPIWEAVRVSGEPYLPPERSSSSIMAEVSAGREIAHEVTGFASPTRMHAPRAIRLVHPRLHELPRDASI